MEQCTTDILIVGGGTGGTVAAIQAARRGSVAKTQVTLVSEFSWLGGMLTSAGVSAPDGNELLALQTGIWGDFLRTVQQRQLGGVDHGWVSCFTFEPRIGADIFAEWVQALPNLRWISGQTPLSVKKKGDRITAVTFDHYEIQAQIILDGTELGDLLALADIPYRWGWDWPESTYSSLHPPLHSPLHSPIAPEPSAPSRSNALTQTYPVQLPTWVVVMQDFGEGAIAPPIPAPPVAPAPDFSGAWKGYTPNTFLNYGRLPGDRFMINWPQQGNDYGQDLDRLVQSPQSRYAYLQEARWHTQAFARYIQTQFGRRYGLATDTFPLEASPNSMAPNSMASNSMTTKRPYHLGGGAYALHPYYRESRRLQGVVTVTEADILPRGGSCVASLPCNEFGEIEAIAIGNYANDHHYPVPESALLALKPKSMQWGGRWTGTPFALPYRCLIPATVDGVLGCEKNSSVSHIANGSTRLQPVVMNIGQAAGMAAALCIEQGCQPRELPVRSLQDALLTDAIAPAAIIPLLNLPPHHPHWLQWQRYYLNHGDAIPQDGCVPNLPHPSHSMPRSGNPLTLNGYFERISERTYALTLNGRNELSKESFSTNTTLPAKIPLITLNPEVNALWEQWPDQIPIQAIGYWNPAGSWLRVIQTQQRSTQ